MTDIHWFDTLSKILIRDAPRRTLLGAAAAIASGLVPHLPRTEAAGTGRKKSKRTQTKQKRHKEKKQKNQTPQRPSPQPQPPCGGACTAGEECCGGQCVRLSGDYGFNACCDGHPVDSRTDENNCGGCGIKCDWNLGEVCAFSQCVCVDFNKDCGACPDGETRCDGLCTDVDWDPYHCGFCNAPNPDMKPCCNGNICPDYQACVNGACDWPTCVDHDFPNHRACCNGKLCPPGMPCINGECNCPWHYCEHPDPNIGMICSSWDCSAA